jgi:hypothetical protein
MAQNSIVVSTTPPLSGLTMVQSINAANQSLATDFAGAIDPAASAIPYSTWADTGTGTLKRRNATNSAWVVEGRLFQQHLPMYPTVPTENVGDFHWIGHGDMTWDGTQYAPIPLQQTSSVQSFTSGTVSAAFANSYVVTFTANVIVPAASRTGKFRMTGIVTAGLSYTTASTLLYCAPRVNDSTNSSFLLTPSDPSIYQVQGQGVNVIGPWISPFLYTAGTTVPLVVGFYSNGAGAVSNQTLRILLTEA